MRNINIPSYVGVFNAASWADSIILADQFLREEGVTLAVWSNREENFNTDEKQQLEERVKQLIESYKKGEITPATMTPFQRGGRSIYSPQRCRRIFSSNRGGQM